MERPYHRVILEPSATEPQPDTPPLSLRRSYSKPVQGIHLFHPRVSEEPS